MKGKLDLVFDWKVMGATAYFPLLVILALFGYIGLPKDQRTDWYNLIPALEFTLPVFASWWSVFLFQDVLEEPGSETLFSYPITRGKLGITRVAIFYAGYLALLLSLLLLLDQFSKTSVFVSLAIQYGSESFFFAGLGFLAMVLTADSGWALAVILIYTSTQLLTGGQVLPMLNIFLFNSKVLPISQLLSPALINILAGTVLWLTAQYLFKTFRRYK